MKKILFLLSFLLLVTEFVTGQIKDTTAIRLPQASYDSYMHKRKVNNTAGWITLCAGIGLMGIGAYETIMAANESTYGGPGEPMFYIGAASTLASIPLFIAAGKNKRLAILSVKKESVFIGNKILRETNYAALSLKIAL